MYWPLFTISTLPFAGIYIKKIKVIFFPEFLKKQFKKRYCRFKKQHPKNSEYNHPLRNLKYFIVKDSESDFYMFSIFYKKIFVVCTSYTFAGMNRNIKETGLRTIKLEAESIAGLQNFIDDNFEKAINVVHESAGRLVVSGIGKSAIISQKIVATLNSTGTPALFMHAADAIHGDLGMIQEDDVVMIISKSGESPEIKVLVPLIKGFKNILIGMIGNTDSFLAKNADIILNTTISQEACTNNLAPTSSTTAQMVMGDAFAVCLMELNNFSGRDFAKYHPGGNLGKRLYLRVEDISKINATPFVKEDAALKDVIIEITKGRLGATAVTDDTHKIIGIITDGDIRRLLEKTDDIRNIKASDFFIKNPKDIYGDALAVEALEKMKQYDINQLLVIDNLKNYSGIIHLHDLIREGII